MPNHGQCVAVRFVRALELDPFTHLQWYASEMVCVWHRGHPMPPNASIVTLQTPLCAAALATKSCTIKERVTHTLTLTLALTLMFISLCILSNDLLTTSFRK